MTDTIPRADDFAWEAERAKLAVAGLSATLSKVNGLDLSGKAALARLQKSIGQLDGMVGDIAKIEASIRRLENDPIGSSTKRT